MDSKVVAEKALQLVQANAALSKKLAALEEREATREKEVNDLLAPVLESFKQAGVLSDNPVHVKQATDELKTHAGAMRILGGMAEKLMSVKSAAEAEKTKHAASLGTASTPNKTNGSSSVKAASSRRDDFYDSADQMLFDRLGISRN